MRDTNGAGATGFVATNQVVGHHMDRDIFEKHGNDGNIFVVARPSILFDRACLA
jgi:hypothetical protein|tara:strand:+ start:520 stop:681 length:162 start_codon:yes stop_codon:yes gene_type:complete